MHRSLYALAALFAAGGLGVADGLSAEEPAPLHERIDALLEGANFGLAAPLADDAEFLRRAYLDLNGTIPDAATVRAFLDDAAADKRPALVDRLLGRPQFARHMAQAFDVMLMERRRQRSLPGNEWTVSDDEWREYLRHSFVSDKPLNQLAREILAADGTDEALRPAVKFYFDRDADPDLLARDIGRLFFGRDLQCAQCHDHPLVKDYLQAEYYGLKAFVARGTLFEDTKVKKLYYAENAEGEVTFKSVFTGNARDHVLPELPQAAPVGEPVLAKEEAYVVAPAKDVRPIPKYSRRAQLAALATDGSNLAFNRNLANRLWAMIMGRGLAHPLDMQHSDNPAVESQLLATLGDALVQMKFDTRAFLRELVLSRTYQRSSVLPSPTDVKLDQAAIAANVAAWQAEQEKIAAELPALEKATDDAGAALDTSYEQFAAAATARAAAEKARGEVKKGSDELSAALAAAVKDAATQDETLKALVAARVAADAAVAKLPEDKVLADAAAQFKNRANDVDTKLAELRKAIGEKTPQIQAASVKLAEQDQALAQAVATLTTARAALDAAETAARTANDGFRAAKARSNELLRHVADGQATLDYLAAAAVADQSQTAATAANEQYAASKAQSSITQEQLLAAEQAGLSAAEKAAADRTAAEKAWNALANRAGERFSWAALKPLAPEQLAWSTMQAVGLVDQQVAALAEQAKKDAEAKTDLPAEQRPAEEARLLETRLAEKLRGNVGPFVSLFGQEPGQPPAFQATVHQALFLANGGTLTGWLNPGGNNLTERLSKLDQPAAVADELYLSVLSRRPTADELAGVTAYWQAAASDRATAAREMVWALLTCAEFRFNH
ncbi:MAG: DUF1549 domain-containing protein [Pirellulales bacterium]